jgi:hypothetical protein
MALKNKESQLLIQIEQIQKECLMHLAERQAEVSWNTARYTGRRQEFRGPIGNVTVNLGAKVFFFCEM